MFTLSQLKQSKYIRMLSRNRDIVLILKKGGGMTKITTTFTNKRFTSSSGKPQIIGG